MTATDPDDPLLVLAAEVRVLTTRVTESTISVNEAAVAANKATVVAREVAAEAVARGVKVSRRRFALGACVLLIVGVLSWRGFDAYRHDACVRGNETRAAIVATSGLTVTQTARELEPLPDAQRRGERVQAQVALDPRLMPREC